MRKYILLALYAISLLSCDSGKASVGAEYHISEATIAKQQMVQSSETIAFISAEKKGLSPFYRTESLYRDKLKISIPVLFKEMSADKIALKYPNSVNRPDVVYTNERASINIAFTQVAMSTVQEDLPQVKEALSQQLQAVKPINFQSRIEKINGYDYVILEFENQAIDSKIYNLMFATDIDGKMLMGTFNCTETLKGEWRSRAKEILLSIRKE